MESGQPPQFIWTKVEKDGRAIYSRLVKGKKLELWVQDGKLMHTHGFEKYVHDFLRMDDDLVEICERISTDKKIKNAIGRCSGLRLTKSEPWETLVCFVCSINNNIPRIRKMVQSLMKDGEVMTPREMLATDLSTLKLGYRQKYLEGCAKLASEGKLAKIGEIHEYEKAKEALMEFPGVGPKVADCVLLFGFGFTEAFPVDVWMMRAMKGYGAKNEKHARELAKKWGKHAGYAQQYLFHSTRTKNDDHLAMVG